MLIALFTAAKWRERIRETDTPLVSLAHEPPHEGPCQIADVLGGDLVLIRQEARVYRLRLLGVHVPGELDVRARAKLKELAASAIDSASIDLDKRRATHAGDALAWLYIGDQLAAAELLREGFARCEPYPGDDMAVSKRLREVEDEAQAARRGLWANPSN
jgi:endonuclease YncB( thermonuclease family)